MKRRDALRTLAAGALSVAFRWSPAEAKRAAAWAAAAKTQTDYVPRFFTAHEWDTVRLLADIVIPTDERSGGARDAGVPEFIDFLIAERIDAQVPMRGGLAWLDNESRERFSKTFLEASDAERADVLALVAWPRRAKPEHSQGVTFFNTFRDLTASGFWSSKIGIADLQYKGNEFVAEWNGCPPPALDKLGVRYE